MPQLTVTASDPTPSNCAPEAVDVTVEVTFPTGQTILGEVTLAAREQDGLPAPIGDSPDCWVSRELIRALYASTLSGQGFREALNEIQAAAIDVVPGSWNGAGRYQINPEVLSDAK